MTELTVAYFLQQDSFIGYCLQSNPDDVRVWERYIQEHPDELTVIAEAKDLFHQGRYFVVAERLKPAAVKAMQQYLEKAAVVPMQERKRFAGSFRWVAAASILLALAGVWWWMQQDPAPVQQVVNNDPAMKPVFLHNLEGKARRMIALQDGSYALLDSGSVLRIDSAYGIVERRLFLTGTAWFNVKKDGAHPFRVITGPYLTTALGTAFRIQTAKGLRQVKVELEEGKVTVHRHVGNEYHLITTLSPAESILLNDAIPGRPTRTSFSLQQLKAWKASEIVFRDAPLADVVAQLELYYNVTITVENKSPQSETFTGKFNNDQLNAVLDMLCFSLNRQYKFTDNHHVLIY